MGERLAKNGVKPDLVVSSPAVRALTTAELIARELDYDLREIVVDKRLYSASADDLLAVIHELGGKPKHVMLVGHNPEFAELAHSLSSDIAEMPTCAAAEFTLDIESWSDVGRQPPAKAKLYTPKES